MADMKKTMQKDLSLDLTDASGLMEKQSVRATFRLSVEFIDALRVLSAQLGIKQKSLFDHLMEDVDTLRAIAGKVHTGNGDSKTRVQKTFVMSRKSLSALDTVSKRFDTSRDDLVEYSIQRLLPILRNEQGKQSHRETVLNKLSNHCSQLDEILEETADLVGQDDPVYQTLHSLFMTYKNAMETMESLVNSGKRITDLSMEKFNR